MYHAKKYYHVILKYCVCLFLILYQKISLPKPLTATEGIRWWWWWLWGRGLWSSGHNLPLEFPGILDWFTMTPMAENIIDINIYIYTYSCTFIVNGFTPIKTAARSIGLSVFPTEWLNRPLSETEAPTDDAPLRKGHQALKDPWSNECCVLTAG